jgi:methionyl-tRNA formyltransferase
MLDWRRPASELDRLVRAAAPFPGAAAHLRDRYVEVVEAHVAPGRAPAALRPGEAFRTATGWTVRCGDGRGLALDRLRGADGAMVDVDAWLAPGLA